MTKPLTFIGMRVIARGCQLPQSQRSLRVKFEIEALIYAVHLEMGSEPLCIPYTKEHLKRTVRTLLRKLLIFSLSLKNILFFLLTLLERSRANSAMSRLAKSPHKAILKKLFFTQFFRISPGQALVVLCAYKKNLKILRELSVLSGESS